MWLIIAILALLQNICCIQTATTQADDLAAFADEASRTTIVTYEKGTTSISRIEALQNRLRQDCQCEVAHLPHIGAFTLTYTNRIHTQAATLETLDGVTGAAEDDVITIPEPVDESSMDAVFSTLSTDTRVLGNLQVPNDPGFRNQYALAQLSNNADINAQEGWAEYLSDSKGASASGPKVLLQ